VIHLSNLGFNETILSIEDEYANNEKKINNYVITADWIFFEIDVFMK